MFTLTQDVLVRFWGKLINFIPDFFAGFLILIIGVFLAGLLKKIFTTLLTFIRLDSVLEKTKLISRSEVKLWEQILAEIIRWTIVILFLIPTLETWGLSGATVVLNQFLFYLPNVIVAVVVAFIGLITSNLVADLVRHSIKSLNQTSAHTLAILAKSTLIFFTVLIILNQLGVAQDLIRILFTGIVSMLALAGGLAFGLGGRKTAEDVLENIKSKIKNGNN